MVKYGYCLLYTILHITSLYISNNSKGRVPRAVPVGECVGGDML